MRLFTAIAIPPALRSRMSCLVQDHPGLARVPAEQLHLTLRFLGEFRSETVPALRDSLAQIRVPRFAVIVQGADVFFRNGQASVLWLRLVDIPVPLLQLKSEIDARLSAIGVEADKHGFVPHITLARQRKRAGPGVFGRELTQGMDEFRAEFPVESFELFSSELSAAGARHMSLASFPLKAG